MFTHIYVYMCISMTSCFSTLILGDQAGGGIDVWKIPYMDRLIYECICIYIYVDRYKYVC